MSQCDNNDINKQRMSVRASRFGPSVLQSVNMSGVWVLFCLFAATSLSAWFCPPVLRSVSMRGVWVRVCLPVCLFARNSNIRNGIQNGLYRDCSVFSRCFHAMPLRHYLSDYPNTRKHDARVASSRVFFQSLSFFLSSFSVVPRPKRSPYTGGRPNHNEDDM